MQMCHQIVAASDLVRAPKKSKADHPLEKHVIHSGHLEQPIKIGADLTEKTKAQLVASTLR